MRGASRDLSGLKRKITPPNEWPLQENRQVANEAFLFGAMIFITGFFVLSVLRKFALNEIPLLPLVASVQLVAGLRLGAIRGGTVAVAGGLSATFLAMQSNNPLQIILNPLVAGGLISSLLSALMLQLLQGGRSPSRWERNTTGLFYASIAFIFAIALFAVHGTIAGLNTWSDLVATILLVIFGSILVFLTPGDGERSLPLLAAVWSAAILNSLICTISFVSKTGFLGAGREFVGWLFWVVVYSIAGLTILDVFHNKSSIAKTISLVRLAKIVMSLLAVLGVLYLLLPIKQPMNLYDEGVTVYGAMRVSRGEVPYRDFWTMYAPGQFYIIALLFRIFYPSILVERLWTTLVYICICIMVYLVVRKMTNMLYAGLAAVLCMIWLSDYEIYGTPVPVSVLFSLISIYFMLSFFSRMQNHDLILSGAMAGVSALIRQDLGLYTVAGQVGVLIAFLRANRSVDQGRHSSQLFVRLGKSSILSYILGFTVTVFPIVLFFYFSHIYRQAVEDLILFAVRIFPMFRSLPYPSPIPDISSIVRGTFLFSQYWFQLKNDMPFFFPPIVFIVSAIVFVRASFPKSLSGKLSDPWPFLMLLIVGCLFFGEAIIRADKVHLLATSIPAIMLLALILTSVVQSKRWGLLEFAMIVPLLLSTILVFSHLFLDHIQYIMDHTVYESAVFEKGPGAGMQLGHLGEEYEAAVNYIDRHVPVREKIFVGLERYDKIFVNDVMFYFLANRQSATRYQELHPGLATTPIIQQEIQREIIYHRVRYIVVLQQSNCPLEPNMSSMSSGCNLLGAFIHKRFAPVKRFGNYTILKIRSRRIH